jgi:hypothetical protein
MQAAVTTGSNIFVTSEEARRAFAAGFNQSPFLWSHKLQCDPLFEVPNLLELACRMAAVRRHDVYHDTGDIDVRQKWTTIPVRKSLEQALDQLAEGDTWVILKSAHKDPVYGPVLAQGVEEIAQLSGLDLAGKTTNHVMSVLLASPRRVTPYHMDGDCNFLLQIRGSKTVYIFNGNDRSVVSEEELERFWNTDKTAANYKEVSQSKASEFHLEPGLGVHIPLLFPHWVRNGADVSVSVSINFEFSDTRQAELYRANYYIRKLGLRPTRPGKLAALDAAKLAVFRPLIRLRSRV